MGFSLGSVDIKVMVPLEVGARDMITVVMTEPSLTAIGLGPKLPAPAKYAIKYSISLRGLDSKL